jgi:23S rRNA-/tRNA-specific pseudouridylate synthase
VSSPLLRWVTPDGISLNLGELVVRFGSAADGALAEGRLFVNGRRETEPDAVLAPGSVVDVHAGREPAPGVAILAEHGGLVFASKPPGVATEPDHAGIDASLVARVAALLGVPRQELHAVSRLDVGVSGIVTLARDALGRQLATELRAKGHLTRRYLALTPRAPEPAEGVWTQALAGKAAATRYATVALAAPAYLPSRSVTRESIRPALVALSPFTGRMHQLRLHAQAAGASLLGDSAHGGATRLLLPSGSVRALGRVCLHAAWVELVLGGERLQIAAPLPEDLLTLWGELGGTPEDWPRALEIALAPGQG